VLLSGAYQVFNYWSVRTKRFTTIAICQRRLENVALWSE